MKKVVEQRWGRVSASIVIVFGCFLIAGAIVVRNMVVQPVGNMVQQSDGSYMQSDELADQSNQSIQQSDQVSQQNFSQSNQVVKPQSALDQLVGQVWTCSQSALGVRLAFKPNHQVRVFDDGAYSLVSVNGTFSCDSSGENFSCKTKPTYVSGLGLTRVISYNGDYSDGMMTVDVVYMNYKHNKLVKPNGGVGPQTYNRIN